MVSDHHTTRETIVTIATKSDQFVTFLYQSIRIPIWLALLTWIMPVYGLVWVGMHYPWQLLIVAGSVAIVLYLIWMLTRWDRSIIYDREYVKRNLWDRLCTYRVWVLAILYTLSFWGSLSLALAVI
jgi:hypothetical protein